MDFFGIGVPELVLIMVIVLVVFGPDQLPEIAKKLGSATRDIRRSLTDINAEVNENLQPFQEIKQMVDPLAASQDDKSRTTAPPAKSNLIVAEEPLATAEPDSPATSPAPPDDSALSSAPSESAPPEAPAGSEDWSV